MPATAMRPKPQLGEIKILYSAAMYLYNNIVALHKHIIICA